MTQVQQVQVINTEWESISDTFRLHWFWKRVS